MSVIPIIASVSDLESAIRHGSRNPNSQWYIAKRAAALGVADVIPADWPVVAAGMPDFLKEKVESADGDDDKKTCSVKDCDKDAVMFGKCKEHAKSGSKKPVTAAAWSPNLHPRDRNGKFLELGDTVNVMPSGTGGAGFAGTLVGSKSLASGVKVTVRLTEDLVVDGHTMRAGSEVDANPRDVVAAPDRKARVASGLPSRQDDGKMGDMDPITAAAGWDDDLHPRDRKGRFIEKMDLVSVFSLLDPTEVQFRGTAVGVFKGNDGATMIQIRREDGTEISAPVDSIESAPDPKARLDGKSTPNTIPTMVNVPVTPKSLAREEERYAKNKAAAEKLKEGGAAREKAMANLEAFRANIDGLYRKAGLPVPGEEPAEPAESDARKQFLDEVADAFSGDTDRVRELAAQVIDEPGGDSLDVDTVVDRVDDMLIAESEAEDADPSDEFESPDFTDDIDRLTEGKSASDYTESDSEFDALADEMEKLGHDREAVRNAIDSWAAQEDPSAGEASDEEVAQYDANQAEDHYEPGFGSSVDQLRAEGPDGELPSEYIEEVLSPIRQFIDVDSGLGSWASGVNDGILDQLGNQIEDYQDAPDSIEPYFRDKLDGLTRAADEMGVNDLADLIEFRRRVMNLGWAQSEQFEQILGGEPIGSINPAAARNIAEMIDYAPSDIQNMGGNGDMPTFAELSGAIRDYLDNPGPDEELDTETGEPLNDNQKALDGIEGAVHDAVGGDAKISEEFERWVEAVMGEYAANDIGTPEEAIDKVSKWTNLAIERKADRDSGSNGQSGWRTAPGTEAGRAEGKKKVDDYGLGFGKDRLALFPIGDPREYNFGGYEVWHVNEDGTKNGGRGDYPDRDSAQGYIDGYNAEYDRVAAEQEGLADLNPAQLGIYHDKRDEGMSKAEALEYVNAVISGEIDPDGEMKSYKVQAVNEAGEREDFVVFDTDPERARKAADVEAGTKGLTVQSVGDDAADAVEAIPGDPEPTQVKADQVEALNKLWLMARSANKDSVPFTEADATSRLDAVMVLANGGDADGAHRDMARLMTEMKLGGKQRKRYRELLDEYMGATDDDSAEVSAAATAATLSDDNPVKERLAAKAAQAAASAAPTYDETGGETPESNKLDLAKSKASGGTQPGTDGVPNTGTMRRAWYDGMPIGTQIERDGDVLVKRMDGKWDRIGNVTPGPQPVDSSSLEIWGAGSKGLYTVLDPDSVPATPAPAPAPKRIPIAQAPSYVQDWLAEEDARDWGPGVANPFRSYDYVDLGESGTYNGPQTAKAGTSGGFGVKNDPGWSTHVVEHGYYGQSMRLDDGHVISTYINGETGDRVAYDNMAKWVVEFGGDKANADRIWANRAAISRAVKDNSGLKGARIAVTFNDDGTMTIKEYDADRWIVTVPTSDAAGKA